MESPQHSHSEYVTKDELERRLAEQEALFSRRLEEVSRKGPSWSRFRPGPRVTWAILAVLVGGFFLYCTWPGLFIGFDNDDVTNLYRAWEPSFGKLLAVNLVPFTTFYRPAGSAYYRICFDLFGWHPEAFRAVTYGLMLTNLLLLYLVARRLTKSNEIGVLSALLYCFHGRLKPIYMDNGAVYDVLCATLSLLALLYYIRLRQDRRQIGWPQYILLTWLFIAAVNAKEMAAILPALFFLYDWFYDPPGRLRPRELLTWLRQHAFFAAFTLLLALLAFWGKRQPGGAFYQQAPYKPLFTVRRFFENERNLISELFYLRGTKLNTTEVVLFYAALFGLAAATRRKHLWFLAWFALLAPLPIIFLSYRGFFVMYFPLAAYAMYLAAALVEGRDWVRRTIREQPALPADPWATAPIATFALIALLLPLGRNRDPLTTLDATDPSFHYVPETHDAIERLKEPMPKGARVLLVKCPYPDESWGPLMMLRMTYNDPDLSVDRPAMMPKPPGEAALSGYDRIIDFDGQNLVAVRRKSATGPLHLPR